MTEDKKIKRMSYLADVLIKYTTTEPRLTSKDIAIVLASEIEDITEFLKHYKKELKSII